MIGLDTNVLVRYIAHDDRRQAAKATHLIEEKCSEMAVAAMNGPVPPFHSCNYAAAETGATIRASRIGRFTTAAAAASAMSAYHIHL